MISDFNSFDKIEEAFPSAINLSKYLRNNGIDVLHINSGYELQKKLLQLAILNLEDFFQNQPENSDGGVREPIREFCCLMLDIDARQLSAEEMDDLYNLRTIPTVGLLSFEMFCDDVLEKLAQDYNIMCPDKDDMTLIEKQTFIARQIANSKTPDFGARLLNLSGPTQPIHPPLIPGPTSPAYMQSLAYQSEVLGAGAAEPAKRDDALFGSRLDWSQFPEPHTKPVLRPPVPPEWFKQNNLPPNIFDMLMYYEQQVMYDYFSRLEYAVLKTNKKLTPGSKFTNSQDIAFVLMAVSPENALKRFTLNELNNIHKPFLGPLEKNMKKKDEIVTLFARRLREMYLQYTPQNVGELIYRAMQAGANLSFVRDL